jgi:hypothetical protein
VTAHVVALGLTLLVHVIGAGVLIWALLDGEKIDWRSFWPRDDDGGGYGGGDGAAPEPPVAPVGGLPLPDAAPSAVRLREPGRIGDALPRPARRPEHAPDRVRPRAPQDR